MYKVYEWGLFRKQLLPNFCKNHLSIAQDSSSISSNFLPKFIMTISSQEARIVAALECAGASGVVNIELFDGIKEITANVSDIRLDSERLLIGEDNYRISLSAVSSISPAIDSMSQTHDGLCDFSELDLTDAELVEA